MQLHINKRHLQNLWRRKVVRTTAVVIVLLVAFYIQYRLVNRPEPFDLASSKVAIPEIFAAQKLHVEAQAADTALVIAHSGKLSEEVDVHFNKARLGAATLSDYEEEHPPTAATETGNNESAALRRSKQSWIQRRLCEYGSLNSKAAYGLAWMGSSSRSLCDQHNRRPDRLPPASREIHPDSDG